MTVSPISATELDRVLQRAKRKDDLGHKIANALDLIDQQLQSLGEEAVAISFNGGKDCTVLLHLYAAALYSRHERVSAPDAWPRPTDDQTAEHSDAGQERSNGRLSQEIRAISHSSPRTGSGSDVSTGNVPIDGPSRPPPPLPPQCTTSSDQVESSTSATRHGRLDQSTASSYSAPSSSSKLPYPPIRSIYITAPDPFPELETFVLDSAERYGMDLYRFGGGMKAALEEYLNCGGGRGVKGVLVGTRRGDPNGDVSELAPTDPSWPQFLRIHPILFWSYGDIWTFLRELDVHWCSLYDQGYTSLGSTKNTVANPELKRGADQWEPAWKLQDESKERAGRFRPSIA
ncbi:hypothetical protein BD324DRAFT_633572 [Kockovaella imperatae]|uniref:FAD synthase n=1 Tax=Kockovaella imperatae TaxID=4999 RepID=A0A1Y1UAF2_9TREE|nr:hypothetical protein BD324DRAFT_633572 [Kockovaella imperatae]ORX34999.1 hypothetical protein BD324DRAFT_633572 [Kockovaella imperatae]